MFKKNDLLKFIGLVLVVSVLANNGNGYFLRIISFTVLIVSLTFVIRWWKAYKEKNKLYIKQEKESFQILKDRLNSDIWLLSYDEALAFNKTKKVFEFIKIKETKNYKDKYEHLSDGNFLKDNEVIVKKIIDISFDSETRTEVVSTDNIRGKQVHNNITSTASSIHITLDSGIKFDFVYDPFGTSMKKIVPNGFDNVEQFYKEYAILVEKQGA